MDENGGECDKPLGNIKCELIPEATGVVVGCKVENIKNSQYEISYQPTHRGKHQLSIRVEEVHIRGSPFTVVVKVPIQRLGTPVRIIDKVSQPWVVNGLPLSLLPLSLTASNWGVAVRDSGEIVVAENESHCVSIFTHNGTKIRTFGTEGSSHGQFSAPRGVVFDSDGNILVADGGNYRIQKFKAEGEFLTTVGRKGSGYLEFECPVGIGINHLNKKLCICECSSNRRVQILNENLTFSSSFSGSGSGDGQFNYPWDVAFDSTGSVYIADGGNHRIQVFTPVGGFLREFGRKGSSEGELNYPSSVSIDSEDIVYVAEKEGHRVSIFTCQGKFIRSFGIKGARPGEFTEPCGIAVNASGLVYVSDRYNHRIQIF